MSAKSTTTRQRQIFTGIKGTITLNKVLGCLLSTLLIANCLTFENWGLPTVGLREFRTLQSNNFAKKNMFQPVHAGP